jgi:hypothetical protein
MLIPLLLAAVTLGSSPGNVKRSSRTTVRSHQSHIGTWLGLIEGRQCTRVRRLVVTHQIQDDIYSVHTELEAVLL